MQRKHNGQVSERILNDRKARAILGGFPIPRWVVFCEAMIAKRYNVYLREALTTYSKYITVRHKGRHFKVRFSNHKPSFYTRSLDDCDIWVGVTNDGVITTEKAIEATIAHMEGLNDAQ